MMSRRLLAASCILICGLLPLTFAGETEALTWRRHFKIEPGKLNEFTELLKEAYGETWDAMLAEGALLSWGLATPLVRGDENWNVALWLTAPSWEHVDRIVGAMAEAGESRGESETGALDARVLALMEPDCVRDVILHHVVLVEPSEGGAEGPPRYLRMSYYRVVPGREEAMKSMYTQEAKPNYQKLIDDGGVVRAGFAEREIMTDTQWTHASWSLLKDLSALDTVRRAFKEAEAKRSPEVREHTMGMLTEIMDIDAYHSQLLRIIHFSGQQKQAPGVRSDQKREHPTSSRECGLLAMR